MTYNPMLSRWRPEAAAGKWHAIAKRRREHLVELYDSGRWRRYFTEEVFLARMREAVREVEGWQVLANPPEAKPPSGDAEAVRRGISRAA